MSAAGGSGRPRGLPWHAGIPTVSAELEWPDACHRITWRAGKLTLDHHRDLAAEEAYIALGGERCPCLDVLEAWSDWAADPGVLVRWADHAGPPPLPMALHHPGRMGMVPTVTSAKEVLVQLRSRYQAVQGQLAGGHGRVAISRVTAAGIVVGRAHGGSGPPGAPGPHGGPGPPGTPARRGAPPPPYRQPPQPSPQQRRQMLAQYEEHHREMWRDVLLWALPRQLRDRLAFSAVVGASRRRGMSWHRWKSAVEVAMSCRAVPAMHESIRCWRGRVDAGPRQPVVESWVTAPDEPVTLFGLVDKAGGWAAASLPDTWLVDVWARGLAVVDGCFVLAVLGWDEYPHRLHVVAARWERRLQEGSTPVIEPAVVVPRDAGGWTLRWVA